MSREPVVFLELRNGIAFLPLHIARAPRQNILHAIRVEIRPMSILLTWDALARFGFYTKDIIDLCMQEKEQIRLAFTPQIAPGYVRYMFVRIIEENTSDSIACLELVVCHKAPYRVHKSTYRGADVIPIFNHRLSEKVG